MCIPDYFDVTTVTIISSDKNIIDVIPVEVTDDLLLHTLEHIEEYVFNTYECSCTLQAMNMKKMLDGDGEEITIADFLIQLD